MSWLLITFIIISIIVAYMELYSIFSSVCETMLWMYSFCVLFLSQILIVSSFLEYLSIFFTLEDFMYMCPFIVGSNIYNELLSVYDLLTLETVDSLSVI